MLTLARYRLHFTALSPVNLPEWPASALRGAFGHALRRLACMTRQKDCADCPLLNTCPYPATFAPAAPNQHHKPPPPYIIEPAAWGRQRIDPGATWYFDLVLFGRALADLPLIILAWQRAAQHGIGPGDGQSILAHIDHLPENGVPAKIWTDSEPQIQPHEPDKLETGNIDPNPVKKVTLNIESPMRLQDNARAIPSKQLVAAHLLMAAVRRSSLVVTCHGTGNPPWPYAALTRQASKVDDKKDLKWQDWGRYSQRQGQSMQLGGVIGKWTLSGDLTPFMPALRLGEVLHIGKETVFGLGRYRIIETFGNAPNHWE